MPTALITGITGQDGSYLAEFLLSKGYKIVGMSRRTSTLNFERIAHFQDDISLIQGDLHDQSSLVCRGGSVYVVRRKICRSGI